MTANDYKKMDIVAELKVRQYFDHFLEKTLPAILENQVAICPYGRQISRIRWALIGASITLGAVLPVIGKPLLSLLSKLL